MLCHNDFAPYNLVFEGGRVVGVIDWDFASPGPRIWDLAYLACQLGPLTSGASGQGFTEAERDRRLHLLLASYGTELSVDELRATVVDRLTALADFSDSSAATLGRPELADHAITYRADTVCLRTTS